MQVIRPWHVEKLKVEITPSVTKHRMQFWKTPFFLSAHDIGCTGIIN
jgi:hypothetical protein